MGQTKMRSVASVKTDSLGSAMKPAPIEPNSGKGAVAYNRNDLFPKEIIEKYAGGDPKNFAVLEVPCQSQGLYNALLGYIAQRGVDLDEELPMPDPEPAADTSGAQKVSKASKRKDGKEELEHLAKTVPGLNDVPVPIRQLKGRLTSLFNSPDDPDSVYSGAGLGDSDSDNDASSGDNDDGDDTSDDDSFGKLPRAASLGLPPFGIRVNGTNRFVGFPNRRGLKKTKLKSLPKYQFGLGFAKIAVGTYTVYAHHFALAPPTFGPRVYRCLVLGCSDPHKLKELCSLAMKWDMEWYSPPKRNTPEKYSLFRYKTTGDGFGMWVMEGVKRSRPLSSVILPKGMLGSVIADFRDFLRKDTRRWYTQHGLPHRRSYLFYGPPGTGKTSLIRGIAGAFSLNASFLSLTQCDFSNQTLHDALSKIPPNPLLVLEDVDVLFNEDRKSEEPMALTFSGLLNALDGLVSVDGILTVMTTNHLEKLDSALIRGGRVDRRFEFCHPTQGQISDMFLSFYPDAEKILAERFAKIVFEREEQEARSIATLQEHFIYTRRRTAEECVDSVDEFFKEFYPKGGQKQNPLYI